MKQCYLLFARTFLAILLFFIAPFVYSQNTQVEGKIIDATSKLPLAGVSVSVKNSKAGTSSDANGNFSIGAPKDARIVVSFVGYQAIEIPASQKSTTIQLNPSTQQLNEVVVTATGIKKEAKRLGYAIQTIDAASLNKSERSRPLSS